MQVSLPIQKILNVSKNFSRKNTNENGSLKTSLVFVFSSNDSIDFSWYAEPTDAMRQKVKAEMDASLDKSGHTSKPTSSLPHSQSITNSIKSPPEPASTVSSATNRVGHHDGFIRLKRRSSSLDNTNVFSSFISTTTTSTHVGLRCPCYDDDDDDDCHALVHL